jgi:hypothetical protein
MNGRWSEHEPPAAYALIEAKAKVVEYPDDPVRTFPTSDPYVRRAKSGVAGLVTNVINDAHQGSR